MFSSCGKSRSRSMGIRYILLGSSLSKMASNLASLQRFSCLLFVPHTGGKLSGIPGRMTQHATRSSQRGSFRGYRRTSPVLMSFTLSCRVSTPSFFVARNSGRLTPDSCSPNFVTMSVPSSFLTSLLVGT